jgi:hypothetical protein
LVITGQRVRFVLFDETAADRGQRDGRATSKQRGTVSSEGEAGERHVVGFLSVAPTLAIRTPRPPKSDLPDSRHAISTARRTARRHRRDRSE